MIFYPTQVYYGGDYGESPAFDGIIDPLLGCLAEHPAPEDVSCKGNVDMNGYFIDITRIKEVYNYSNGTNTAFFRHGDYIQPTRITTLDLEIKGYIYAESCEDMEDAVSCLNRSWCIGGGSQKCCTNSNKIEWTDVRGETYSAYGYVLERPEIPEDEECSCMKRTFTIRLRLLKPYLLKGERLEVTDLEDGYIVNGCASYTGSDCCTTSESCSDCNECCDYLNSQTVTSESTSCEHKSPACVTIEATGVVSDIDIYYANAPAEATYPIPTEPYHVGKGLILKNITTCQQIKFNEDFCMSPNDVICIDGNNNRVLLNGTEADIIDYSLSDFPCMASGDNEWVLHNALPYYVYGNRLKFSVSFDCIA